MVKFNFAFISLLAMINIGLCEVINLSCKDIKILVDGHNRRRRLVASGKVRGQPAASNMKFIKWDEELAAKAEAWAARGDFSHNPDREIASQRFTTGENLHIMYTTARDTNLNLDESIDGWFKEHEYYSFGRMSTEDFNRGPECQTGHYTQMVWANTVYLGCGLSKTQGDSYTTLLLVCNYGPPGNYMRQEPYKRSKKASRLVGNLTQLYGPNC